MNSVITSFVTVTLLVAIVITASLQQVLAQPAKDQQDPCKAFKLLIQYVQIVGLNAVATGDHDKMSALIHDFRDYANTIIDLPPPDKGKC